MIHNLLSMLEKFNISITIFSVLMYIIIYFCISLYLYLIAKKRKIRGKWKAWLPVFREFYALRISENISGKMYPEIMSIYLITYGALALFISLTMLGINVPAAFVLVASLITRIFRIWPYQIIWQKIAPGLAEMAFIFALFDSTIALISLIHILSGYMNRAEDDEKEEDEKEKENQDKTKVSVSLNISRIPIEQDISEIEHKIKRKQNAIEEAIKAMEEAHKSIEKCIDLLSREKENAEDNDKISLDLKKDNFSDNPYQD